MNRFEFTLNFGEYARYYKNRRCDGFGKSFDINNEEAYFDATKNYILEFKKHLIQGCPYCLDEFENKKIKLNLNSSIFKDII